MRKNLLLFSSMLLILGMFMSMAFVAITRDKQEKIPEDAQKDVKQILRINIGKEPQTLHPGLAEDETSGTVVLQTFEGLTRIDLWGQTVNAAAKVIKISKDQRTYTFTLRETKWSNGDPVIAQDFEYAWKWALDPNNHSESAKQLYYIEGAKEYHKGNKSSVNSVAVKALDNKTLQVRLVNPTPNFIELTALPAYFPINSKGAVKNPNWAKDSKDYISNGPFRIAEWSHNDKIVLKKSENYWDSATVRLEKITMYLIDDPLTEVTMFDKGELDRAGSPGGRLPGVGTEMFVDFRKINSLPTTGHYIYKFNTEEKPFNNENIRKAFALSINRQEIVDLADEKGLVPATAIVPPNLFPENKKGYFQDNNVDKAKDYLQKGLKELGYQSASELPPVTVTVNSVNGDENIAQAVQKMWKDNLEVEVSLKKNTTAEKKDNIFPYKSPSLEWPGYYNDPYNFLCMFHYGELDSKDTNWKNEEFESILIKSQTEKDKNQRVKLLKNAERILMDEMPVIPIYFYSNYWVEKKSLKSVALSGLGHIQYKWAYLEK